MKVCLARVDRIGDLILTLPLHSIWKQNRPQDEIHWLVSDGLQFVIEGWAEDNKSVSYVSARNGLISKIKGAIQIANQLKGCDLFLAFHVPWWVALGAWLARIPNRVGAASQWYSWLLFNRRLRQKRSQAVKHESHYNLDLMSFVLGTEIGSGELMPAKLKTAPLNFSIKSPYVVLHPGMAGSARNWPALKYLELGQSLVGKNINVVVTGSEIDRPFIEMTGLLKVPSVQNLVGQTDGKSLLGVLSHARVVVAPSTGVAHLAASLGVRTIGIYSPIRVQAPLRWKPLGPKVTVFCPTVPCPAIHKCLGHSCKEFDCMNQIAVDAVASVVIREMEL